jgi:HJR/Mrr/RecB family endonuclease
MPDFQELRDIWSIAKANGSWVGHVDAERSLVIPRALTKKLYPSLKAHFFLTSLSGSEALLYPFEEWERIMGKLAQLPFNPLKKKFLSRVDYYGQAIEGFSTKPLSLTAVLCESAGLHGEVLILNAGSYFKLYDLARLNELLLQESVETGNVIGSAGAALASERRILGSLELPGRFDFVTALDTCKKEIARYLASHPDAVFQLKPRVFEKLIAEVMRSLGYEVELTAQTRDGGKDLIAIHKDSLGIPNRYIVECKRWKRSRKVSVDVVRALYGVKQMEQADQSDLRDY